MMMLATTLVISLSNQGHWLGGQAGRIEVQWATPTQLPNAALYWQLEFAGVVLAHDEVALRGDAATARIDVTPPVVCVRTDLHWTCHIRRQDDGTLLAEGARAIHAYPTDILTGVAERLRGRTVLVCDGAAGLPRLLAEAGIEHLVYDGESAGSTLSPLSQADIILVGTEQSTAFPFDQAALINHARAGRTVALYVQTGIPRLCGYPLLRRPRPASIAWRTEHALLAGFEPTDLREWVAPDGPDLWAVQLPADEAALEVAYWPREAPGDEPVPIDALLVVRRVGAGRVILCQVPIGDWHTDPRAQLLLQNTLDYAMTRPEPTPPPSRRGVATPASHPTLPSILIPAGV